MVADKQKPIFLATHPRSCSTAFERVFMHRKDITCAHEPFGDAFYYGPERISERYEDDQERENSGFAKTTYANVVDHLKKEDGYENTRLFIKDMAQYLIPHPSHKAYGKHEIAASLKELDTLHSKTTNPTVLPLSVLSRYHFTFLIRHPRHGIPSYYRCCVPPLSETTGFKHFIPSEAGYSELKVLFEYLVREGLLQDPNAQSNGDKTDVTSNGTNTQKVDVCVIDADDLLDYPEETVEKFCQSVGLDFSPSMLEWPADQKCEAFDKWKGFHNDAIGSSGLKARPSKKEKSKEEMYKGWVERYGEDGAKIIDDTAEANIADYEYLKKFKIQISSAPVNGV